MELPILPPGMTKRMVAIAGNISKVQGAGFNVIPLAERKKCSHISGFKGVKFRVVKKKEEHYITGTDAKFDVNPYPTHFPGVSPKTRMAFVIDDNEKLKKSISGAKTGYNREVLATCINAGYFEIMDKEVEKDVLRRAKAIRKALGTPDPKDEGPTKKSYQSLAKSKRDKDADREAALSEEVLTIKEENKKLRKQMEEYYEDQEALKDVSKLRKENEELKQKAEDAQLSARKKTMDAVREKGQAKKAKEKQPEEKPEMESL